MDKYKIFVEAVTKLQDAVKQMEVATTRNEIETLEKNTRDLFNGILGKLPYIQADIHEFACKQASRVSQTDTNTTWNE